MWRLSRFRVNQPKDIEEGSAGGRSTRCKSAPVGDATKLGDAIHIPESVPLVDAAGEEGSTGSPIVSDHRGQRDGFVVTLFILILGFAVGGAFMGLGIASAFRKESDSFERNAWDLVKKLESAWEDYINAAAMIHGRCRNRTCTRQEFRNLYEYLNGSNIIFQAAQFDPFVTHEERHIIEAQAREYYATHYPHVKYRGIVGFNTDDATEVEVRDYYPFYYPIHFMEPIPGNEAAIDLDYHASGSRRRTVQYCIDEGRPAITDRLRLVQETAEVSYGVVLMHPGHNLTHSNDTWPQDLASIVVRIPDLITRSAANQVEASSVYVYNYMRATGRSIFLGASNIVPRDDGEGSDLFPISEVSLSEIRSMSKNRLFPLYQEYNISITNRIWTIAVVASDDTFTPDLTFVIVAGVLMLAATIGLAVWVHLNTKRVARLNRSEAEAKAEKAALVLEGAQKAAQAERELNDFMAHEVRNPVAAAMSACNFVKTAIKKKQPLMDEDELETLRSDVHIIDNALKFVNDLLRNMLDMHRAVNKQLKVSLAPTDVLHDVLEPVQSLLFQRSGRIQVPIDCPPNTYVMADRLRLNQVILNLGRNSYKFVEEGFIRLRATRHEGYVAISVEDSGPGIPHEKRNLLFQKYQESLDMLSQGTGIGLFVCKNLVSLMEGDIYLDESYDSGVPQFPGARFVVTLKVPPPGVTPEINIREPLDNSSRAPSTAQDELIHRQQLPETLSVLFVDDDPILRKLFARTVKTVAPNWNIREASNGETALHLVESQHFDLIFMDMYMASVQKQLLGTEAVAELRIKGVASRICGLSANDKEKDFLDAGADAFTLKPFPCEKNALREELWRILYATG